MDKPGEQALNPKHERKEGRDRDSKSCDDIDIGVRDHKAGGKLESMNGLWSVVSEEVVGLPPSRLMSNCYKKEEKVGKEDLLDDILDHGPPLMNTSKPKRVF